MGVRIGSSNIREEKIELRIRGRIYFYVKWLLHNFFEQWDHRLCKTKTPKIDNGHIHSKPDLFIYLLLATKAFDKNHVSFVEAISHVSTWHSCNLCPTKEEGV